MYFLNLFMALCFLGVLLGEEQQERQFTFPLFANEDMITSTRSLSASTSNDELSSIPEAELRGIMTTGNLPEQARAAGELVRRGDTKTILRIVYSLKQGNVAAEEMLTTFGTLTVIPYLLEDVAHGSLEKYGVFQTGDVRIGSGRVRVAATKLVSSTLAMSPEFTAEARDCLRSVSLGREYLIQGLTDKSRYLIEWWLLNRSTLETGSWKEALPLPYSITYVLPRDDTSLPYGKPSDLEKRPRFGSPELLLAEPFGEWAERIVDPKRRNLDFVALSWDGTKVVEHPAKSLDPRTRPGNPPEREPRKTPSPRNSSEPVSGNGVISHKRNLWILVVAVLMLAFSIARWLRRKPTTKV